jgi:hypothetical protein
MLRLFRLICLSSERLCIGFIVGSLSLHSIESLVHGAWVQALMDVAWIIFILVGYRFLLRWIDRPVTVVVPPPASQVPVATCRFELCGEHWVLRELHTRKLLFLEEGDILQVVIGAKIYEGEEDD